MAHATNRPRFSATLGAALILSLAAASGAAAEVPARPLLAQAQPQTGQKPGPAQRQSQAPADPVEAQLADLKKKLKITAEQQQQFEALAQTIRQNQQEMTVIAQKIRSGEKRNAVENLRMAAQLAQAEAESLNRLVQPLEALYATLSDQQKRTADQLFGPASQQQRRKG